MSHKSKEGRATDPRVLRTKALIIESLVNLMKTTAYKKIKIQDITSDASIARQTFYLHYPTKDEVLLDYINAVFEQFYAEIEQPIIASPDPDPIISWHLFNQWKNHASFAQLVIEADVEHLVIKSFRNYITRVTGLYIRAHNITMKDPEAIGFMVDYLAGASWMMLHRWISTGFAYPLDKISTLYREMTHPGVLKILNDHDF